MSDTTPTDDSPRTSAAPLTGIARWERWATLAAIVLAAIAAIYLYVMLFSEHEVCYGLSASKLLCQPLDAAAFGRATVVWGYLAVLFGATALGAWWHAGATEPSARSAAYGLTVTSWVVLIGILIPGVAGSGLYLLPAGLAITAAVVLATIKFFQDFRSASRATREQAVSGQAER
jgi:hypothetical protein